MSNIIKQRMNWELFGICAGLITVSGYIPQIIKGYQNKTLEDILFSKWTNGSWNEILLF